jgi:hypothetical protein
VADKWHIATKEALQNLSRVSSPLTASTWSSPSQVNSCSIRLVVLTTCVSTCSMWHQYISRELSYLVAIVAEGPAINISYWQFGGRQPPPIRVNTLHLLPRVHIHESVHVALVSASHSDTHCRRKGRWEPWGSMSTSKLTLMGNWVWESAHAWCHVVALKVHLDPCGLWMSDDK